MAERTARDVLADRIETWIEDDWKVYDYADRLIRDLWAAGFAITLSSDVTDRELEAADRRIEELLDQIADLTVRARDWHQLADARAARIIELEFPGDPDEGP